MVLSSSGPPPPPLGHRLGQALLLAVLFGASVVGLAVLGLTKAPDTRWFAELASVAANRSLALMSDLTDVVVVPDVGDSELARLLVEGNPAATADLPRGDGAPYGFLHAEQPSYLWVPPSRYTLLHAIQQLIDRSSLQTLENMTAVNLCALQFAVTFVPPRSFGNTINEFFNVVQFALLTNRSLVLRGSLSMWEDRLLTSQRVTGMQNLLPLLYEAGCMKPKERVHVRSLDVLKVDRHVDPSSLEDRFVSVKMQYVGLQALYERAGVWNKFIQHLPETQKRLVTDPAAPGMAFLAAITPHVAVRRAVVRTLAHLRRQDPPPSISIHVRHRQVSQEGRIAYCIQCILRWDMVSAWKEAVAANQTIKAPETVGLFLASDLPASIQRFQSDTEQERAHTASAVCASMDAAMRRAGWESWKAGKTEAPTAQPLPTLAPLPVLARQQWKVHSFDYLAYNRSHWAEIEPVDLMVRNTRVWGEPGKLGWWGPSPLWAALVDLYVLAALQPKALVGSDESTFSEIAAGLALPLMPVEASKRFSITLPQCILREDMPDGFARLGLVGPPKDLAAGAQASPTPVGQGG